MRRRLLMWGGGVAVVAITAFVVLLRPIFVSSSDWTRYLTAGQKYDVRVLRDSYGVPHVYGKHDADVAFGLAYAHAEDDFATIQQSLLTSRGRLALADNQTPRLINAVGHALGLGDMYTVSGADPAVTDYLAQLLRVRDRVSDQWDEPTQRGGISQETRDVLDAYALGFNLYAAEHPDQVLPGLEPVSAKDIAAGYVFFLPLFFGFDRNLRELFEPERQREMSIPQGTGSNAMAVAPSRSDDKHTRLLINSHQPYAGPLAWYEARVKSDDGWDMVGGLFPGSAFINHGFGPRLGWANTVNSPDLTDVYVLTLNPENPDQYKFDGKWRDFDKSEAEIQLRVLGSLAIRVTSEVLWSVHGPVIKRPHGTYAIRFSGLERINQVETYHALNKAHSWTEFEAALKQQTIPSFNFTYADATGRIAYIYNAVLPKRDEAYDWQKYLPGDTSRTLWTSYLPYEAVPRVVAPASGFVYNANNHPFMASEAADNLKREDYSQTFGIETRVTNRALRLEELLGADRSISADEFRAIKFDKQYSKRSELQAVIADLRALDLSKEPDAQLLQKGQAILRGYDMSSDAKNRGAALAIITGLPVVAPTYAGKPRGDGLAALRKACETLMTHYGRLDPEWGEVNRFRRGEIDAPANGGPDVLRDFEASLEPASDGKFEAAKGDTLYYIVDWDPAGRMTAQGIHQFGSATLDAKSSHYADQSPIFLREELKSIWMDEGDLRQHLEREYRPGRK